MTLPSVSEVQKHLEKTFYKTYKDDHVRDCHVEAVLDAVKSILKQSYDVRPTSQGKSELVGDLSILPAEKVVQNKLSHEETKGLFKTV